MTYRRTDKPPFSAWLSAERRRHGLKVDEVARRLRELGFPAEESTYRTWEAGRRPAQETVVALERMFGTAAPGEDAAAQGDVAAAIDRQTAVITALVDELRAAREDRDRIAGLERAVEQLLAAVGPIERAGAASRAPRAPRTGAESGR